MNDRREGKAWRDYEEKAAELFARMGFVVTIEEVVEGARGKHEIDVVARTTLGGVLVMWIVECKHWKSAVPKAHVLTLAQVAQDVGADRAVLLSEKGFQAGAIAVAHKSNVLLTNVEELGSAAADSIAQLSIQQSLAEVKTLENGLQTILYDYGPRVPPPAELDEVISLLGACLEVTLAAVAAQTSNFPVRLPTMFSDEARWADSLSDVARGLASDAAEITRRSVALKRKVSEVLKPYVDGAGEMLRAVAALMDAGEALLEPAVAGDEEKILQRVLASMRAVGVQAEALRSAPSAEYSEATRVIMRQLIDGPFLWFSDPDRKRETWDRLKTQTREALARLNDIASRIAAAKS